MKMPLLPRNILLSSLALSISPYRNSRSLLVFGSLVTLLFLSQGTQAQIARVGVAERVVEKRTGAAGSWKDVQKGATLSQGDGLRTGKRSKVDTLFRDGSLVRLGQLSSLEIQSGNAEATRVRLQNGRVIFVKKPGSSGTSRVLTGTGAAEIKGSVVLVEHNEDGSDEYTNFSGSVSVVGLNNGAETQRVELPPGHWVKSFPAGLLSPVRQAAPFSSQREMIIEPVDSPFAGSTYQELARAEPGILHLDTALSNTNIEAIRRPHSNPFIPRSPLPGGQPPFGGPFPSPPQNLLSVPLSSSQSSSIALSRKVEPNNSQIVSSQTAPVRVAQGAFPINPSPSVNHRRSVPIYSQVAQTIGQGSEATLASAFSSDFGPTYRHLEDVNRRLGQISGIEYRALAMVGNNDLRGAFGYLHMFSKQGALAADLTINPQNFQFDVPTGRIRRSNSVVSHATLAYEAKAGSIIAGRQRFLSGPIRASYFGSMTRFGGREIMDAVRLTPNLGSRFGAEVSYLYDAFPRNLPYNIRNNQQGFLGRVYTRQKFGNFGLNVLRYTNSPVRHQTGLTLDFSIPVLANKLDFYGEVGNDPFHRNLRTFGITIPYLYEKTNFDLYIEHAQLDSSATSLGIGNEWAVRLYRNINDNISLTGAYNRFRGGNSSLLFGLSIGSQAILRSK